MPHTHPYNSDACVAADCAEAPDHNIHHINPKEPEYVILEPDYRQTTRFLCRAVVEGSHEDPAQAMGVIIDSVRYLTQKKDLDGIAMIIDELNQLSRNNKGRPQQLNVEPEDYDLESQYEDRFLEDMD